MQVGVRDSSGRYTHTFDITVKLPTGTVTPLNVHHDMNIGELKSAIEFSSGIPSDLMTITYGNKGVLTDNQTLGQLCFIQGTRVPLRIIYGFEDLVNQALSGDAKSVLKDIEKHHESDIVWRRKHVALFMAAHRGYFFLVDKLLSLDTIPRIVDAQTPSGRTALHAACAMGNLGCVDSLLQHNAALDVRDGRGHTPAQVAFSCGQQDAERRIFTYQRVRSKQKREKQQVNQSWPRSSRFPSSKLAQSTSPTLALNELIISPGPTFKITPWKCNNVKTPWTISRATPKALASESSSDDSSSSGKPDDAIQEESADDVTQAEQDLNTTDRTQLRPSRHASSSQQVRFTSQTTTFSQPCAPKAPLFNTNYSLDEMRRVYDNRANVAGRPTSGILKNRMRPSSAAVSDSKMWYRQHQRESQRKTVENLPPTFELTPSEVTMVVSLENGDECISAEDIKLPPKVRDEVDRMRRLVDLPVEYPEEEFGVAKIFGNQRQRPGTARRRATPEENQKAYKLWVASKSQDARDRKLVNKVSKMLDEAFGRTPEQFKAPSSPKEDGNEGKCISFEEWIAKKHEELKKQKAKQEKERAKKEKLEKQKQDAQITERVKAIDQWVNKKLAIEREKHILEREQVKHREAVKTERQLKAEEAFNNWSMQKQWQELEQWEKRPHTVASRASQIRTSSHNRRQKSTGQIYRTRPIQFSKDVVQ